VIPISVKLGPAVILERLLLVNAALAHTANFPWGLGLVAKVVHPGRDGIEDQAWALLPTPWINVALAPQALTLSILVQVLDV